MKKSTISGLLFVILVLFGAYFVSATFLYVPGLGANFTVSNISEAGIGAFTAGENLSGTIAINASFVVNGTHNNHLTNVTYQWNQSQLIILNTTVRNTSRNQSDFINTSFDTTLLPDGLYNITILVINFSNSKNTTTIEGITIDNSNPKVGNLTYNLTPTSTAEVRYSISTSTLMFNVTAHDNLTNLTSVLFEFDNASYTPFNVTATLKVKNNWSAAYNVSTLRGGYHTVKVIARDFAGNVNQTINTSFFVNTPPNVTIINSTSGLNFSATEAKRNHTFNVSVTNRTTKGNISSIVFQFNNASGTDFNRTVFRSNKTAYGRFFLLSYNISSLDEGAHTVTIFANDTLANVNKSVSFSFTVDRTAPLISVSCLPDSPSEGVDVECTCTATDTGDSGIKIAALFGHGTATESFKASGTSEVSSSVCSSTDYAGNKGTGSGSFTPTAASGGSGGSSGGSGGGISRAAAGNFKKTTWNSINAGEIATVEPDNGVIGVSKVSFGLKEKKWGVWMKVAKKDSIPSEFKPFGNKAHKIIEITKSLSIKEGDFVSPTIDIKVEKSWVNDNNLGRNDVALHRYHDSVWNQLETEFVKDDGTYLHYSAKTPGFSYFIIGTKDQVSGKTAEEVAEAAAEAMALEEASEEAPGRDMGADGDELVGAESNLTRNIVIVLAVLIVIAVAAFLMKRRK